MSSSHRMKLASLGAGNNEEGTALTATSFTERLYSVSELADIWRLSANTIRRIFQNEPGVLRWGSREQRFKRRYTTLRIPESVALRIYRQMQTGNHDQI